MTSRETMASLLSMSQLRTLRPSEAADSRLVPSFSAHFFSAKLLAIYLLLPRSWFSLIPF